MLPYGTTKQNIGRMLEAVKSKAGDGKWIRASYKGANFESTRDTLETLGILADWTLTPLGLKIAFAPDARARCGAYLAAIRGYAPYWRFLSQLARRGLPDQTNAEELKNYWERNGCGATENNRSEAAFVCFSFFELAGLGRYMMGRKGRKTRMIWADGAAELLQTRTAQPAPARPTAEPPAACDGLATADPAPARTAAEPPAACDGLAMADPSGPATALSTPVRPAAQGAPTDESSAPPRPTAVDPGPSAAVQTPPTASPTDRAVAHSPTAPIASIPGAVAASLAIRVDITDWPLEKIQGLFALIRGADLRLRLETP